MIDRPVKLPFLKLNSSLPYYFDESNIIKIFSICNNLKHYCMLNSDEFSIHFSQESFALSVTSVYIISFPMVFSSSTIYYLKPHRLPMEDMEYNFAPGHEEPEEQFVPTE